ncbi:MAG: GspE/PulE family protein, partial [Candidatus Omnitrophota bacterium]
MKGIEGRIYNRILSENIIPRQEIDRLAAKCQGTGHSLYQCILDEKLLDEKTLVGLTADILSVPHVNLRGMNIDESAVRAVPVRFAWYYKFMPVSMENSKLTIAVSSPLSVNVQDEIRLNLGFEIALLMTEADQILEQLKKHYGLGSDTVEQMISQDRKEPRAAAAVQAEGIEDIEKLVEDASVIKLVNQIILEAYRKRATDIHIEPYRGTVRFRYRIDGVLYDQRVPEELNRFLMPILSRVKIMSNMDIVERRIPQDGRAVVRTQDQMLDLRISFIPTPHGESVVIRMLPTKKFFGLDKLGLSDQNRNIIESLGSRPNGIVFLTGPTGSGKTTTLYACLEKIDKQAKKVITIEDPIEYEIKDTTQIQVNPSVGLTFASGLRSMLRHDPDVIMVGEVRDKETAEIAIRVALTGHLVFST